VIKKKLNRHEFIEKEFGYELEWDSIPSYGVEQAYITQREWNRTLILKINNLSAQIYQYSRQGGADTIKIGSEVWFMDLDFYCPTWGVDGCVGNIGGRYKVYVDENVPYNEIWVSRETPTHEIGLGEEDIHEIPTLTFYSQMMDKKKLRGRVRINE